MLEKVLFFSVVDFEFVMPGGSMLGCPNLVLWVGYTGVGTIHVGVDA